MTEKDKEILENRGVADPVEEVKGNECENALPEQKSDDISALSSSDVEEVELDEDMLGDNVPMTKGQRFMRNWETTAVIAIICVGILIAGRVFRLVRVVGSSMEPTYHAGNILATTKNDLSESYDIECGDIVVCDLSARGEAVKDSDRCFIKRVVGRPGDRLQVIEGVLYRNGEPEEGEYPAIEDPGLLKDEYTLQANEFFLIGDNRNNSYDSRSFGPVKEGEITRIVRTKIF